MPVTYTNRKGKTYTLCQSQTKKGNTRFFFASNLTGKTIVEQIPEGIEIRESVNGQVSLRKKLPQIIAPEEFRAVETALARHPKAKNYRADVKGKYIVVYENFGLDTDVLLDALQQFMPFPKSQVDALRKEEELYSKFSPVMRFELFDPETRRFSAARMSYSGHGGWNGPAHWGPIESLAEDLIPILGGDDFLDEFDF